MKRIVLTFEDESGKVPPRRGAVGLLAFGRVNAGDTNLVLSLSAVQHSCRVVVWDGDDGPNEGPSTFGRRGHGES
jgi:hypothetical protein